MYTSRPDNPTSFELDDKVLISDDVEFIDTYTDASLKVETARLDASNSEFQELKLKIILDNMKNYSDAWSRPYFDIELPEYITEIDNQFQLGVNAGENIHFDKDISQAMLDIIDGKLHFIFSCEIKKNYIEIQQHQ